MSNLIESGPSGLLYFENMELSSFIHGESWLIVFLRLHYLRKLLPREHVNGKRLFSLGMQRPC